MARWPRTFRRGTTTPASRARGDCDAQDSRPCTPPGDPPCADARPTTADAGWGRLAASYDRRDALVSGLNALHACQPRSSQQGSVAAARPLRFVDTSGDTGLDQVLEVYEIVERLSGGGSGGVVLLAEHRKTREKVAIKEIPKTALNTDRKMEMARREMDIMMMVSEEAPASVPVVRLHAIVETSCFIHVVMEVAEGGELFDHIVKAGCYSESKARRVMRQLLEALRHLHGMGITHRDIKPENILCTDANGLDIKLADFGLSSLSEASSMMRSQCGTPIYMAPEMLQRRPYGAGVDVWSAGIVMYTVLSGTLPFYAENHGDFLDLLLSEAVSFPEDEWGGISREATDLISGMLAVDPKRRLSVEEVLDHPWMRAEA